MLIWAGRMTINGRRADANASDRRQWQPGPWFAWGFYDIGQRPFNALILTYIFAPYFASTISTDPARGQAAWGLTIAFAGLLVAIMAPPLGAVADATGRKKPWIAFFGGMIVAGSAALWWAQPGDALSARVALVAIIIAIVGSEMSIVFHNALLPMLARRDQIGRLSALGWSLGIAGVGAALLVVLGALAVDPRTGLTLGGWPPLLALEPVESTAGRLVGPLVAIWFATFVLPMFLYMPDDKPSGRSMKEALRVGLSGLHVTIAKLRKDRKLSTFLLAYLLYSDGLITLIAFGGVYAAGLLDWGSIQLAGLGLALGVFAGPIVLLTGQLDDAAFAFATRRKLNRVVARAAGASGKALAWPSTGKGRAFGSWWVGQNGGAV